jgi:hypothetical protein
MRKNFRFSVTFKVLPDAFENYRKFIYLFISKISTRFIFLHKKGTEVINQSIISTLKRDDRHKNKNKNKT